MWEPSAFLGEMVLRSMLAKCCVAAVPSYLLARLFVCGDVGNNIFSDR